MLGEDVFQGLRVEDAEQLVRYFSLDDAMWLGNLVKGEPAAKTKRGCRG
jgi:hypothetical protein